MATAPKADPAEMKQLGSDASQEIGPLKKAVDEAFKTAGLVAKNPNPKLIESLAEQVEDLMKDVAGMKNLLKELKEAAK